MAGLVNGSDETNPVMLPHCNSTLFPQKRYNINR